MAKIEEIVQAYDEELWLTGIQRSMRCNTLMYQVELAKGADPQVIAAMSTGNCSEYTRLLDIRQGLIPATPGGPLLNPQALANGQKALGIDGADHAVRFAALRNAVLVEQSAAITGKTVAVDLAIDVVAALPDKPVQIEPINGVVIP